MWREIAKNQHKLVFKNLQKQKFQKEFIVYFVTLQINSLNIRLMNTNHSSCWLGIFNCKSNNDLILLGQTIRSLILVNQINALVE